MATPLAYLTTVREEQNEATQEVARASAAPPPATDDPTAFAPRAPSTPYESANPASSPRLEQNLMAQSVVPGVGGRQLPESEFRDAVQTRINDGFGTLGYGVAQANAGLGGRESMPIYNSLNPVIGQDFGGLYFEADDVVLNSVNTINGPQFTSASDALAAAQATQASRAAALPVPYNLLGTS